MCWNIAGLEVFDAVHGIDNVDFHPKPDARAYAAVIRAEGFLTPPAPPCSRTTLQPCRPAYAGDAHGAGGSGRHGPDDLAPGHDHRAHVHHQTADLRISCATLLETASRLNSDQSHISIRGPRWNMQAKPRLRSEAQTANLLLVFALGLVVLAAIAFLLWGLPAHDHDRPRRDGRRLRHADRLRNGA